MLVSDYYGHHGGGPFFGWLFFALVIVAFAGLAAWAVYRPGGRGGGWWRQAPPAPYPPPLTAVDPALAALRLRYARSELSREEFLRVSSDLGAPPVDAEPPGAEPPPQ
jgi:uncharacterized membrane protein